MGLPAPIKATLRYTRRVLVATDQWANAIFGGEPDETISYRAAEAQMRRKAWGCLLCRLLDLAQKDHCGITLRRNNTQRTLID